VEIGATDKPLRALLYAGRPLHEAVVARGPFVMNTEAEIEQAYADYRAGRSVRSRVSENQRTVLIRSDGTHAQIVCGHFGDNRSRESDGLRRRGNRFEVSQTPVRVAIARLRSNAWLLGAVPKPSHM
jgi:hypothetical protein